MLNDVIILALINNIMFNNNDMLNILYYIHNIYP